MNNYIRNLMLALLAVCALQDVHAFSLDTYAAESQLANGKWVKISVPSTGMYAITAAQLKQWGFSNPNAVRVYGYGATRISNQLSLKNYVDDLPLVQSEVTANGIVFYGVGPEKWTQSQNGIYYNESNLYSSAGYYFLTETQDIEARAVPEQGLAEASKPIDHSYSRQHYEYDRVSPGEAGHLLVGESFRTQNPRKFTFPVSGSKAKLECGLVTNSSFASTMSFSVNGNTLAVNDSDKISSTTVSAHVFATYNLAYHEFDYSGSQLEVSITVKNASTMSDCWLDYLAINSWQPIALGADAQYPFWVSSPAVSLNPGSHSDVRIWDVTDPLDITAVRYGNNSGSLQWTSDYHGERAYIAWDPSAVLPSPSLVGTVSNQNLHGMDCVDMVIFTPRAFMQQAQRIADIHSNSDTPLKVAVLDIDQVYNEFSSGAADVSAMRKCMKMLYDRGQAVDSLPTLRYALLLGRATYDNRHLTSQFDGILDHPTIPCWVGGARRDQVSDNTGYGTDDFISMLSDNSGNNMGMDDMCVAVGRIPARSVEELKGAVDKLVQYVQKSKDGTWKNSFLFLADDGDNGVHVEQTERMIQEMLNAEGAQSLITKVYVDAYDIVAGSCEGGRSDMYRMLDEGVVWWNFCGHANNHSWTGENMLNYNDINSLFLTKVPVLMAATCDFLRWDSETLSGGEIFFHERYGGTIAQISATRPVYINENGYFTRAIGRAINQRDSQGQLPRLGDIYVNAKNNILNDNDQKRSSTNRLRYVLMGDPAMQLQMPSNIVSLDSIAGRPVDIEEQVTLKALQRAVISGSVRNPRGQLISDFNGTVAIDLYDAEYSITTQGLRENNVKYTFEQHGDKLYSGSAPVSGGKFSITVAMPGEVADNFRPATMNMYAVSTDSRNQAVGVNRDFYVFGLDETVPVDTVRPNIDMFVLNHETFQSGGIVNESPMVIAMVSDDVGINLSTAGVGHQMTLTLDGKRTYTDVAQYYKPSVDGTPSGTINYPLEDLTEGSHTLRLRVWDTSGNSAVCEIEFAVMNGLAPAIYDVYCDSNPASVETNFYIRHDRPDGQLTVTITVYNLMGRPLWKNTVKGRSDMFLSSPVTWDLTDSSGRRVPRGIYLYRAEISADDGNTYTTASRKLAVTAY